MVPKTGMTAAALAAAAIALLACPRGEARMVQAPALELDPVVLSAAEQAKILRGKIILRDIPNPRLEGRTYEAIGALPGTLEEGLAVILDYRHYDRFMPRVERVVVTDEAPLVSLVEQHLKLPLGATRRYRLRYTARVAADAFRVDWVKVPWPEVPPNRSVKDTSGHWQVGRSAGGGLLAVYHVYTDPGRVPLGMKSLALSIAKNDVPKVMEAVRNRLRLSAGTDWDKD